MAWEAIELIRRTEEEASAIIANADEKAKEIIQKALAEKKENKIKENEIQKKAYDDAIICAKENAGVISEENKNKAILEAEGIKEKLLAKKEEAIKIVIDHVLKG